MRSVTIGFQHFDTDLGTWDQAVWAPPELSGIVRAMWYFEGKLTYPRERSFPPGAVDILVRMTGGLRKGEAPRADRIVRAEVVGQATRAIVLDAPDERSAVLGIRLHEAGAYALFGHPIHELTDHTVDLADLAAEAGEVLAERCADATSAEQALKTAAAWVRDRTARPTRSEPAVTWAHGRILATGGRVPIAELRERIGMSKTRFTAAFREQVGVAPKVLARVTRFRRALELVRGGQDRLTDIALSCGYYDQAHFSTEFRTMSGFTPGGFPAFRFFPASTNYMAEPGE